MAVWRFRDKRGGRVGGGERGEEERPEQMKGVVQETVTSWLHQLSMTLTRKASFIEKDHLGLGSKETKGRKKPEAQARSLEPS